MVANSFSNSFATLRWFLQASLGIALVVLLGIHVIINHWAAPQGLLTYADVIRYYDIPGIAGMEAIFLIAVITHCMLGLHGILLDLNLGSRLTRIFTYLLFLTGATAIAYGVWLVRIVASLSAS